MSSLRVALVSEHASPLAALGGQDAGGQNVHVAALARALADRGHRVEVYTRRDDTRLPPVVPLHQDTPAGGSACVVHVPAGPARPVGKDDLLPYLPKFGAWLARRWSRRRPDLVHAHFWMSGMAAMAARDTVGVPVLQTFHALGTVKRRHQRGADTSPRERIDVERRLACDTDAVVATCRDEVSELLVLGAPAGRLHVVPCGVDLTAFTPDGPVARRGTAARVVTVGRLVERKGIDTLIAALAALPGTELVVAGGPDTTGLDTDEQVRRLREAANRHGVADRLLVLGRVSRSDMPALLRSADVVACTPWYEPFGIVPLEAMACGVPVLATAVGGMLDTVVPGQTGLHVPPHDVDRLVDALRRLLDDPRLRAAMGRHGAARARAGYGWHDIAARTEAVYRQVLHPVNAVGGRRGDVHAVVTAGRRLR